MDPESILATVLAVILTAVSVSFITRRSMPNVREVVDTYSDLSRRVRELEADHAADRGQIQSLEDRLHKLIRVASMMSDGIRILTGQVVRSGDEPEWEPPEDMEEWVTSRRGTYEKTSDFKVTLMTMLNEGFDLGELRYEVVANLDIDYEHLPGTSKLEKIQALVGYCARHGQMDELLQVARSVRPHMKWPQN